jgi:predicted lysophospholipase L1 biosynthesis ABC-type transport system permease subunit
VAVVNESFVRRFSADRPPIGRRVFLGPRDFTIVGVVSDLMARDVQERTQDGVYTAILQSRPFGIRVMARGAADPAAMMPAIRETLRRIDPDMPVTEVFTLHEAVYRDKRVLDVLSTLFLIFGVGALSLTAIGLYGVVSFGVTQRTREIGIRLALGATRANVLALVVGQGGRQLAVGLGVGLLLAIALSRGFAAAVEQLPPADAPLLLGICAALAATAIVALVIPAKRASRLEILHALRHD